MVTGGKGEKNKETGGKGTVDMFTGKKEADNMVPSGNTAGQNMTDRNRPKSYSDVVIEGVTRKVRMFMGDSMVRKTDKALNKGDSVVVCLPGAKTEHVTEMVEKVLGPGKEWSILVHVGTNNTHREGTTTAVHKYRQLVRKEKQAMVGK